MQVAMGYFIQGVAYIIINFVLNRRVLYRILSWGGMVIYLYIVAKILGELALGGFPRGSPSV